MGAQAAQDAAGAKVLDVYPCTGLAWCLGKDGWPHHCCSTARLLDWASDSSSCEWFGSGMRAYSQSLV